MLSKIWMFWTCGSTFCGGLVVGGRGFLKRSTCPQDKQLGDHSMETTINRSENNVPILTVFGRYLQSLWTSGHCLHPWWNGYVKCSFDDYRSTSSEAKKTRLCMSFARSGHDQSARLCVNMNRWMDWSGCQTFHLSWLCLEWIWCTVWDEFSSYQLLSDCTY